MILTLLCPKRTERRALAFRKGRLKKHSKEFYCPSLCGVEALSNIRALRALIRLVSGDILKVEADAAVLSAHPTLVAGSGLSGHFHREAGAELEALVRVLDPAEPCHSVVTNGYRLRAALL